MCVRVCVCARACGLAQTIFSILLVPYLLFKVIYKSLYTRDLSRLTSDATYTLFGTLVFVAFHLLITETLPGLSATIASHTLSNAFSSGKGGVDGWA